MERSQITMSAPDIGSEDIQAVMEVLQSGRLALGPKTEAFEQAVAAYTGVAHAIAVSSGTAGLHLLVRSMGWNEQDEVLVPSFTFAASVNVLLMERVRPVFVDIEPETYNLDPEDVLRRITPRTRGIMVVDVFGHPAEWDALNAIAEKYGLVLLDDCCEALGAEYKGRKIGQFGKAGVFAFYPNKQITTGEGGMIVTNDAELARFCRALRNQGRTEMNAWLEHDYLGYNYRMDEMSAALGLSQMKRIETFLKKRAQVAAWYDELLKEVPEVRPPMVKPYVRMSWFVYVITLREGIDRDSVMRALESQGVPTRAYFKPVHLQPYVREMLGTGEGQLPVTESVARRTIALPFHNNLTYEQACFVVKALKHALYEASRA
ncbi:perosamine synthetase [Armatimonadetes bacterium DC]|nr:perosamine synthetase [Armatimonadetes bacterium DC]